MDKNSALQKLIFGNERYTNYTKRSGDFTPERRRELSNFGQEPYAVIVCCSDSRVVPEAIFDCGLGEIFVIRTAGNTIDDASLGSIEYAVDHLKTKLVVVMGHTGCGAIASTIDGHASGHIKSITDRIKASIKDIKDPIQASKINAVKESEFIEKELKDLLEKSESMVVSMIYDIESGKTEIIK